MQFLVIPES